MASCQACGKTVFKGAFCRLLITQPPTPGLTRRLQRAQSGAYAGWLLRLPKCDVWVYPLTRTAGWLRPERRLDDAAPAV